MYFYVKWSVYTFDQFDVMMSLFANCDPGSGAIAYFYA